MKRTMMTESKALEEIRQVRRGLLDLAHALLRAATTTLLAATGAAITFIDVVRVEATKRVRKPTPGEAIPTAAEGGALHP